MLLLEDGLRAPMSVIGVSRRNFYHTITVYTSKVPNRSNPNIHINYHQPTVRDIHPCALYSRHDSTPLYLI